MQIPKYNSFKEKEENFKIFKINTIDEFIYHFGEKFEKLDGIFRGIVNAEYKIYTTLQREFLLGNISEEFSIDEYINKFKNHSLLSRYFKSLKMISSKISILSMLQHYNAPTPLIDFTSDLKTALYFATEKLLEEQKITNSDDITDFFSIFHISDINTELITIRKTIHDIQGVAKILKNIYYSSERYENEGIPHIDLLIEYSLKNVYLVDLSNEFDIFSIQNNIRILSQHGIFIHNSYTDKPLEIALKEFFINETHFIGSALDDIEGDERIKIANEEYRDNLRKNKIFQNRLEENIITSYDINKSLAPKIKTLIKLNKLDIYSDLDNICTEIFKESIK